MNYHNITTDDMLNGSGLRVVLWTSGCNHQCHNCQNPQTWDCKSGIPFDDAAKEEIFNELKKDYISGITFSGGDPLHENNLQKVKNLIDEIRILFPDKNIWLYTGYTFEQLFPNISMASFDFDRVLRQNIVESCDMVVDGTYIEELKDVNAHWVGSTNQRVIDVKKTIEKREIVLWEQ